jgi:hypothetical protein
MIILRKNSGHTNWTGSLYSPPTISQSTVHGGGPTGTVFALRESTVDDGGEGRDHEVVAMKGVRSNREVKREDDYCVQGSRQEEAADDGGRDRPVRVLHLPSGSRDDRRCTVAQDSDADRGEELCLAGKTAGPPDSGKSVASSV